MPLARLFSCNVFARKDALKAKRENRSHASTYKD